MGHPFDVATAVSRIDDTGSGVAPAAVRYDAEVHDGWDIGGVANGGYVLAIAGRAAADATGRPPLTVTAHYLNPGLPGPAEVVVTPVRAGRRMATVTAAVTQGDRELIRVLATCGTPGDDPRRLVDGAPPDLPPYDQCTGPHDPTAAPSDGLADGGATVPAMGLSMPAPGLTERLAVRLRPGDDGFRFGHPTGRAEIAGWFAFAEHRPIDELALLLAADAFAPPVFNAGIGPSWVPTLELTVHVRAVPAPGPLKCVFRTRFVSGGLLSEDGELWDSAGTLVAQSRQLALTPRE